VNGVLLCVDVGWEAPIVAVVLEEMGVGLAVGEVVDGDDLKPIAVVVADRLEDLPADASEAVDADLRAHATPSLVKHAAGQRLLCVKTCRGTRLLGREASPCPELA
jgi:hypothetical protein